MRSITRYLQDVPPQDGDQKAELQGKKIFASNYCKEHKMSVILVRPAGEGIDVECAMQLLENMARKIASEANKHAH